MKSELAKEDWTEIANDFNGIWNFPHCLGAIDGKHIEITCPKSAGSLFFNFKGFHSIVIMAIADGNYRFTYADVGGYGSEGDAGLFSSCSIGLAINNDSLDFPDDAMIGSHKIPFFFTADDAFPLSKRIMKPYSPTAKKPLSEEEQIFNYRLSRARRCVENAFGILSARFQCLNRCLFCEPNRAQKIVSACILLHNFLITTNKNQYCPSNFADSYGPNGEFLEGGWRQCVRDFQSIQNIAVENQHNGKEIRNRLKNYLNSTHGSVSWQRKAIFLE